MNTNDLFERLAFDIKGYGYKSTIPDDIDYFLIYNFRHDEWKKLTIEEFKKWGEKSEKNGKFTLEGERWNWWIRVKMKKDREFELIYHDNGDHWWDLVDDESYF